MRQTIYGETPKTKTYDRDEIDNSLKLIKEDFNRIIDSENCLYANSLKRVNNGVLNFLNTFNSTSKSEHIKTILKKEFDDCEKIYPYLGDLFIMKFFENKCVNNNNFILTRTSKDLFLNTIKNKEIRALCDGIFKSSSLERTMNIKKANIDNIFVEKIDDICFSINFDTDFLGNRKDLEVKNYRFILIDGFIESIGEIFHLLHFAAKSKEPYMIFCFGMSPEVKDVIIQNNTSGKTQVIPVSMTMDEDTVNILNDLAVVHDCDIVSALKGQTISQETRKELPVGKRALITRKGIYFDPVCSQKKIKSHIEYLKNRINTSGKDTNIDVIKERIRNISSKSISVFIPERFLNDVSLAREVDYAIRFLSFCEKNMSTFQLNKERKVFIPKHFVNFVNKKVNSTKNIFYNLEKLVLIEES